MAGRTHTAGAARLARRTTDTCREQTSRGDQGEQYDLAAERPKVVENALKAVASHRSGMTVAEPLFAARGVG